MTESSYQGASGARSTRWLWIASIALALAGVALAYWWIEPAPPGKVRIAAGVPQGGYFATAQRYGETFNSNGVELELVATAGSVENYQKLLAGEVDFAIVQGGTLPELPAEENQAQDELQTIASVYLEPLFVFVRGELGDIDDLTQLRGKRIAVGPAGSGTRRLSTVLLAQAGLDDGSTDLIEMSNEIAVEELAAGRVDAVMVVVAPDAGIIGELMAMEDVRLMPFRRAEAISRQLPYLEAIVLPEGTLNLRENLPAGDIPLIAPAAMLIARNDTHSAAVLLAAMAARNTHRSGDLLSKPGDFPTDRHAELPLSETADHYFKNGPSFLRRLLPFWASSFVERAIIVLVPLLVLLIPLLRFVPPVYRWQVRSRIYTWYRELRDIDDCVNERASAELLSEQSDRLDKLEHEVRDVKVPLSYMEEFYNLRAHMDDVRKRVREELSPHPQASVEANAAK